MSNHCLLHNDIAKLLSTYVKSVKWTRFKGSIPTKRLACGQALQGSLVVGREKEGELATMCLEFQYLL